MPGFVPGYLVRDDNLEDFEDFETEKVRQQEGEKRKGCEAVKVNKNSDIEKVQEVAEKKVNETAAVKVMEGKTGDKKKAGKQMQLTVHGARNLPKKGMLKQINPYVVVAVDEQEARSTSVNSCNPKWDFVTTFDVERNASQELSIVVFDKDVGYDDLIGETFLGVDDILMTLEVKDIKEAWLELDYCNNAQIQISTAMVDRDQGNSQEEVDNQLSRVKEEAENVKRAMEEAKASLQEKEAAAKKSKEEATLKMKEEAENARRAMVEAKAALQEKVAAAKRAKEKVTSRTKAGETPLVGEVKQLERSQSEENKTKQIEKDVFKTVIDKDGEEQLKTRELMRKEWDDREASLKIIAEQKKRIMAETEAKALQFKQEESQNKSRVEIDLPKEADKTEKENEAEALELYKALKQAEADKFTKEEKDKLTLHAKEEMVEIRENEESSIAAKEVLVKEATRKHNEEQDNQRKRRIEEEAKSEAEALELYKVLKKAEEDREEKSRDEAALKAKEAEAQKRAKEIEIEAKRRSQEEADEAAKAKDLENAEVRRKVKEEEDALRKMKIQQEANEEADALELYRALKKEEEEKERQETEALREEAYKRLRDEREAEIKAKEKADDDIKAKKEEETKSRAQELEDANGRTKVKEAEGSLGRVVVEDEKNAEKNYEEEALADDGTQTEKDLKLHAQTVGGIKKASEDVIGAFDQEQCSSPAVRLPHYERAIKASGPPGLEMIRVTPIKIIQPKAKTPPPAPKQQQCKKHTKCLCDQLGL